MNKLVSLFLERRGYNQEKLYALNDSTHLELLSMSDLCDRMYQYRQSQEKIVVLPDFDMDGIASGVLGYAGLAELGFNVCLFRPNPADGYGFTADTIDRLKTEFPDVACILTCDVGITCYDGVRRAHELGIKVFVTDHHHQEDAVANEADVIVDPCRLDEPYRLKGICGAHVLWQVLDCYAHMHGNAFEREQINRLRVFAGIGTISDIMPLLNENRELVRDSISLCRLVWNKGDSFFVNSLVGTSVYVRAFFGLHCVLCRFADKGTLKTVDDINEEFLGFYFAPLFNCVKRMDGNMDDAFGVFFGNDPKECIERLFTLNDQRKAAVQSYMDEIETIDQPYAPYIYLSSAPSGLLGLLAAKLTADITGPVIVLTEHDDGHYAGSGRSPEWYDAFEHIGAEGFYIAGHAGAFGIGVTDKRELGSLSAYLGMDVPKTWESVASDLEAQGVSCEYGANADIRLSVYGEGDDIDSGIDIPCFVEFIATIKQYEPFGRGFEKPVISFEFAPEAAQFVTMGSLGQHLKLVLPFGFEVIFWNKASCIGEMQAASKVKCLGRLNLNEFKGTTKVNFIADSYNCEA